MKNIKFLRHAQSAGNAGLRTSDPAEIPLTEAGRLAAEAAAKNYEGPAPDLIVVSPFRRAQETAAPFITRFAPASVESWPVQEFTYLSPQRVGASTTQERLPMVEAYWRTATPETNDGEGAESFRDFITRVQIALEKLRNRSEQTILVVCHEMVIKAALWLETRKPDLNAPRAPQRFREYSLTFTSPNLGEWDYPALPLVFRPPDPKNAAAPDASTGSDDHEHDVRAIDELIRASLAYNTGEQVRELFEFIGKIPYFSPFNAMLLHIQRPDARLVLSAKKWAEHGRRIKPGARPLVILATMGPVAFVFDEADTEGDAFHPVPEQGNLFADPFQAQGAASSTVWKRLLRNCARIGVSVVDGSGNLNKAGKIAKRETICVLEVNPNHSPAVRFVTLFHELAHLFCGHLGEFKGICHDRCTASRASAEIEAEATAFLVAQRCGISSHSQRYLSAYVDKAGFSLEAILVAAGKIHQMCCGNFRAAK